MKRAPVRTTTDAIEIIYRRYYAGRPRRLASLYEAIADDEVARKAYELRTRARLTQAQLARRIGTTAKDISRLEDADYKGNALGMLNRIATTLNKRMKIVVEPLSCPRKLT